MQKKWWQDAVAYQIYPRSFLDSNGDGVGDLGGILQKLDYIQALGVNVLWLSPVFRSPMVDNGYDISDYRHIDPLFGTDEQMDRLIAEAGRRGIKILMDLVVNHTSDQHPWFQAALRDPTGPYGDYYLFRETDDGQPPNNLRTYFDAPVWTRVPGTNRWYFHAFAPEQPDLNWENPAVRREVADLVNWWLDKGLGGFRVDAISNLKKDPLVLTRHQFEPDAADGTASVLPWIVNRPGIEAFLDELAERTFRPHGSMTVAEADVPSNLLEVYTGPQGFFSMSFDLAYADMDLKGTPLFGEPHFTTADVRRMLFDSQTRTQAAGGWIAPFLENHDQPRSLDKYLPQKDIGYAGATMLATLFLMLRGTPFIYQGQELGMTNCPMELDEYNDLQVRTQYAMGRRIGYSHEWMLAFMHRRSRDNSRTPFQWDGGTNAGFTTGRPWLKVNPNYTAINAAVQGKDPRSVLAYYKRLIALRLHGAAHEVLTYGSFEPVEPDGPLIAYRRVYEGQTVWVVNNFEGGEAAAELPAGDILLSNLPVAAAHEGGALALAPYQSVVLLARS